MSAGIRNCRWTAWFGNHKRRFVETFLVLAVLTQSIADRVSQAADRPNILWVTCEDTGPQLGCYGDAYATTPNLDQLAARSMRYDRCWSCAPVCAPARTTIISGLWPNSTGAMHMRSQVALPDTFKLLPQYLRDLGYYCSNNEKEDYNVAKVGKVWDESSKTAHWRKRSAGQPFFAVFNFTVSHESQIRKRPHQAVHDPAKVRVPAYHPDLPEVRQDWAQYYDKITEMDRQVGKVLEDLKEDGLTEETIVIYFGDHGSGMPRSKRWLYESGLRVPFLVSVPKKWESLVGKHYRSGAVSQDLVGFIDLAPTMIHLAGGQVPPSMQGQIFLGAGRKARDYIFGFRDRMDERYDCSRAARDGKYLYIRNWMPHRAQGQFLSYMFETPTTQAWYQAYQAGKTNAAQSYFWGPKAPEELYDIEADPDQIHNLATKPELRETLERMRGAVRSWMKEILDVGLLHESEMHARSNKEAPYSMGHDANRYAFDRIERAADLATRQLETSGEAIKNLINDPDSAVRYWGVTGCLIRAQLQKPFDLAIVREISQKDKAPIVRVTASEIVARFGDAKDRTLHSIPYGRSPIAARTISLFPSPP